MSEFEKEKEDVKPRGSSHETLFWIAVIILIILLILSLVVLSIRLIQYAKEDDRAVSLKTNMDASLDVFSVSYQNASGEVTVAGADGEKVIAPGTQVDYTVRLRNTDTIAIDYDMSPDVHFSSEHEIPIVVRLLGPDDEYLAGDAKTWVALSALQEIRDSATLPKGEAVEYIFQWKWPFEGDDAYDTSLGNSSLKEEIGVTVSFSVHSESNLTLVENGGLFGDVFEGMTSTAIFFILVLIALVLLVVSVGKLKKAQSRK